MDIVLSPNERQPNELRRMYEKALREATELYIASAYLTDWDEDQDLGKNCDQFIFICGRDFGLTRKAAMRKALHWMPKRGSCELLAAPRLASGGFHPKIVAWRTKAGRCYPLIGSSNLSKAAFSNHYEAHVLCPINKKQFLTISAWLKALRDESTPITEDWIANHYKEAKLKVWPGGGSKVIQIKLELPKGAAYEKVVRSRRRRQKSFSEIKQPILQTARRCANGEISHPKFWKTFWNIWSRHESRFQGSGIQFTGKTANWRQACRALITIIDAAEHISMTDLDAVVQREIDILAKKKNPARGAWLTEMLCHYFPDRYPIQNGPIKKWLTANRWRGRRGASQGQRYIELAKQLRVAIANQPAGARNLAELDHAIWLWVKRRDRKPAS